MDRPDDDERARISFEIECRRLPGYTGVVGVDAGGVIHFVSPELDGRFGIRIDEAVGANFLEFIDEADAAQAVDSFGGVAQRTGHHQALEIRLRSRGGRTTVVDVVAENCLDDPTLGLVLLNIGDTNDRRRSVQLLDAQAQIVRQIALGRSLAAALTEIVHFVERALPGHRAAAYANADLGEGRATAAPSMPTSLTDRMAVAIASEPETPGAIAIAEEETIVAVDVTDPRWAVAAGVLEGEAASIWSVPIRFERGAPCHGCIEVYGPDPVHPRHEDWAILQLASRLAAVASDRIEMQEHLVRQAEIDPLTGAPNRRVIESMLGTALDGDVRARRRAVCFIDLDHLKVVNDGLGHEAGDHVIREAARRLIEQVAPVGVVGRFGGDEFVAIASRADVGYRELADRCLAAFDEPLLVAGRRWHLSASVGVVVIDSQRTPGEVLRDADAAMYEAKRAGRGRWHLFRSSTRATVVRRLRLEQQLRHAVDGKDLTAWFQPVVDARTWRPLGLETLARWELTPGRWIDPNEFIPLAEEVGLIDDLGLLMVDRAFEAVRALVAVGIESPHVSVNVSPIQLESTRLLDRLRDARRRGEPVESLCLEMTEQHMIDDSPPVLERLEQLLDAGVRLAVDDFGTGYSSLGALHRLPATMLKIDRGLVGQLGTAEGDAVVAAAIGVAGAYRMATVAEGVETSGQAVRLREAGVGSVQGFLFARPAPLAELVTRVRGRGWCWDFAPGDVARPLLTRR